MKERKQYPRGSKVQNWCLYSETQKGLLKPVIRRWVTHPDGKKTNERFPVAQYRGMLDSPDELEKLVIRLNGAIPEELKTRKKVEIKHAYIDQAMLDKYEDVIKARIPNQDSAQKQFGYLKKYFLNYFVGRLDMASPLEWHLNQEIWAWALLNQFPKDKKEQALKLRIWETKEHVPAEGTLRQIIQTANQFMAWLHQRRPLDAKPLVFAPVSKAQFKNLTETRKRLNLDQPGQFIPDADWATIKKNLPLELLPFAMLGYHYGLRRSESLGVELDHLMEDHLKCVQQLCGITVVPSIGA